MLTDQDLQSLRNLGNEAPLEFEKIVAEYSPGRRIDEANKLRAAKRGRLEQISAIIRIS